MTFNTSTDADRSPPLMFLHIGDLHLTDGGLQNHSDFRSIIDDIMARIGNDIDFIVLPGDNADDGTPAQFALVRDQLKRLPLPWHAIPGDHDFKPKTLDHFYSGLGARPLPYAEVVKGCLCLFLDVVSAGSGGPDFRLGERQMDWLRAQLAAAKRADQTTIVFMHVYPADLRDYANEVAALFDDGPVVLVDMGHTHYNELSNDGRTIYAAVRSTGQIEEGDVGFALCAIDDGVVSWRFKPLASSWPFVLITSPADRRLVIEQTRESQIVADMLHVRAAVWGRTTIASVAFRIDDGNWHAMRSDTGNMYAASMQAPDRSFRLDVRVQDAAGNEDTDTIWVETTRTYEARPFKPTGSDSGRLDAWPERHLLGTQLGPNRNGKAW